MTGISAWEEAPSEIQIVWQGAKPATDGPGATNQFVNTLLWGRSVHRFFLYGGLDQGLKVSEVCTVFNRRQSLLQMGTNGLVVGSRWRNLFYSRLGLCAKLLLCNGRYDLFKCANLLLFLWLKEPQLVGSRHSDSYCQGKCHKSNGCWISQGNAEQCAVVKMWDEIEN